MNKIYDKVKEMSLAAALLLSAGFVTSCSQDADDAVASPVEDALHFELYDGGVGSNSVGGRRAATDQTLTTVFAQGDRAGLYIVKGGEVKYANVVLTYSALGQWEAAALITAGDELAGATFYAYYPYDEDVTFDATSATPLKTYVDGIQPAADQTQQETYEAVDVMVATTSTIGAKNTVSLQLVHQKALVYVELPNIAYTFDNEDMAPYVLSQAENVKFTLGAAEVKPFLDTASQTYRLIVNPGETAKLSITFDNSGTARSYDVTLLSQLKAGQYAKYVIDGGVKLTNYGTLQVGDYYCADGSLVSRDATTLPDNVTGVIYRIGTTEGLKAVNSKWSHAMGVSLKQPAAKAAWGASRSSDANSGWYTTYGLEKYRKIENATHEVEMPDNGYQATKAWMSIPADASPAYSYASVMQTTLTNWRSSNSLHASSTDWFVPSLQDWKKIEALYASDLQAQITKAGGDDFEWTNTDYRQRRYWSAQLRDGRYMLPYAGLTTSIGDRYAGVDLNYAAYYRFVFAF